MAKTLLPDAFAITPEMRGWAREKVPTVDIDSQHEVFCDYWRAHGKKMADWQATWRNWMRRAPEFARPGPVTYRSTMTPERAKPAACKHGLGAGCMYCAHPDWKQ